MAETNRDANERRPLILPGFLLIAFLGLLIRLNGATGINFTSGEAIAVFGPNHLSLHGSSVFQTLVNKITSGLPQYSPLAFRYAGVIIGAFFVFFPYYIRKQVGSRTALICSFFFAIDPFLIANSIYVGGNIFTLAVAGGLIIAWQNGKDRLIPLLLGGLLVSGRGAAYLLILTASCIVLTTTPGNIKNYLHELDFRLGKGRARTEIFGLAGLTLAFVFMVATSGFEPLSNQPVFFAADRHLGYPPENSPLLYPLALISYIPIGIFLVFLLFKVRSHHFAEKIKRILLWCGLALLLIMAFPRHRIIDLVWLSVPMWMLAAYSIGRISRNLLCVIKESWPFLLGMALSAVYLILSILSFIYKNRFGLPVMDALLSILVIFSFIMILIIFWVYHKDTTTVRQGLSLITLAILLVVQIATANRVAGIAGNPERELFWQGYAPDKEIVDRLINTSIASRFGTMAQVDIWVERGVSPAAYWNLGRHKLIFSINDEKPSGNPAAIFTSDGILGNLDFAFLGQKFVADSYPQWAREPLRSVGRIDYWAWFFLRDSEQYHTYNYLWLRADTAQ